jgi:hypothetical protein
VTSRATPGIEATVPSVKRTFDAIASVDRA